MIDIKDEIYVYEPTIPRDKKDKKPKNGTNIHATKAAQLYGFIKLLSKLGLIEHHLMPRPIMEAVFRWVSPVYKDIGR